jgi:hypothetical protein
VYGEGGVNDDFTDAVELGRDFCEHAFPFCWG